MKRSISMAVGLLFLLGYVSWIEAAINITQAVIRDGVVHVRGNQAPSSAAIFWEGVALGDSSNSRGAFKFETTDLPEDCVGRLKIGTEKRDVVIHGCKIEQVPGGGVLKTGQTTSFAPGDDGFYQAGTPVPSPRFTDNGDGTVTDNLTGLIWLKNANCFEGRTWLDALSDANGLHSGECGLTDGSERGFWRLPNLNELTSLLDLGTFSPALAAGHPFMNVASTYWASTTFAINTFSAWFVNFTDGGVGSNDKTSSNFVTAVRGGS
jgi:hypothetical protein